MENSMENSTFLTVEEAAQHLRVSPDSVRRFLRDKKLRGVRVGGQWRIPTDALRELRYSPLEETLQALVRTLTEHEVDGIKIPAGTIGYVTARTMGSGGCYSDTITVSESPFGLRWAGLGRPTHKFPDLVLQTNQQNQNWAYVPNEGASRSLLVPRALLKDLRTLINSAYEATSGNDREVALVTAYMQVRAALGPDDRSDEDAIPKADEAKAKALWHGQFAG